MWWGYFRGLCASVVNYGKAMKAGRIAILAVGLALFAGVAAQGGDYHRGSTLLCSDCHTMHYSQTHTYGGAPGQGVPALAGGPNAYLLRQPRGNSQICLACHDGRADSPDVRGANSAGTFIRAAGQLNVLGEGVTEANGHTIGSTSPPPTAGTAWTGNSSTGLLCSHCHATHGNASYRNLVTAPGNATGVVVTYMTGTTYDNTSIVQQSANTPLATHYSVGSIKYRKTANGLSVWCGGCHDYSPSPHHPYDTVIPNSGITMGWFQVLSSRVPVVSLSQTIPGADNTVFCLSCHKAHGSTNQYGWLWDNGATTALEDGLTMDDTCNQCHAF